MDLYAENILDHFKHPHRKVPIANPTVEHEEINHSCGDSVTVQLLLKDGIIQDIGWSGTGCAISQAGMSLLSDELPGKPSADIGRWTRADMDKLLGVPIGPRRFKCTLLALHTVKNALRKAEGKDLQGWLDSVELAE